MPPTTSRKSRKGLYIFGVIVLLVIALYITRENWFPRFQAYYAFHIFQDRGINDPVVSRTFAEDKALGKQFTFGTLSVNVPWDDETTVRSNTEESFAAYDVNKSSVVIFKMDVINYADYSAMVNASPSNVNYFAPQAIFLAEATPVLKKALLVGKNGTIYSFENKNGIKGFELPATSITQPIEIFTPSGHEYQVLLGRMSNKQIEQTLQSIKEVQ